MGLSKALVRGDPNNTSLRDLRVLTSGTEGEAAGAADGLADTRRRMMMARLDSTDSLLSVKQRVSRLAHLARGNSLDSLPTPTALQSASARHVTSVFAMDDPRALGARSGVLGLTRFHKYRATMEKAANGEMDEEEEVPDDETIRRELAIRRNHLLGRSERCGLEEEDKAPQVPFIHYNAEVAMIRKQAIRQRDILERSLERKRAEETLEREQEELRAALVSSSDEEDDFDESRARQRADIDPQWSNLSRISTVGPPPRAHMRLVYGRRTPRSPAAKVEDALFAEVGGPKRTPAAPASPVPSSPTPRKALSFASAGDDAPQSSDTDASSPRLTPRAFATRPGSGKKGKKKRASQLERELFISPRRGQPVATLVMSSHQQRWNGRKWERRPVAEHESAAPTTPGRVADLESDLFASVLDVEHDDDERRMHEHVLAEELQHLRVQPPDADGDSADDTSSQDDDASSSDEEERRRREMYQRRQRTTIGRMLGVPLAGDADAAPTTTTTTPEADSERFARAARRRQSVFVNELFTEGDEAKETRMTRRQELASPQLHRQWRRSHAYEAVEDSEQIIDVTELRRSFAEFVDNGEDKAMAARRRKSKIVPQTTATMFSEGMRMLATRRNTASFALANDLDSNIMSSKYQRLIPREKPKLANGEDNQNSIVEALRGYS